MSKDFHTDDLHQASNQLGVSARNLKGCLISFEGLDGAGKTTQMDLLERWLKRHGIPSLRTREPGGTPLGVELRHLLLGRPDLTITPLAEAFLFQADRAQHFATVILPALAAGMLVITDRCFDSSIAYQGVAQGVGVTLVKQLSQLATQGHAPDLTILLDLDPALVQVRTGGSRDQERSQEELLAKRQDGADDKHRLRVRSREEPSRFDRKGESFHQCLREAFLTIAQTDPERVKVIDATQPLETVHDEIVAHVERLLKASDW